MMTRSRSFLALLLALALLAGACGSTAETTTATDSENNDAEPADPGDDDGVVDEPAVDDQPAEADDADQDDIVDEPEEDDEEPAESDSSSGEVAFYCEATAENDVLGDQVNFFDPASVEEWLTSTSSRLQDAIGSSPAELRDDLGIIAEGIDELAAIAESHDYDMIAATDDLEAMESEVQDAASDRLDAWEEVNCPEVDDEPTDLADSLTTPEGLEAILGSEAGRALFIQGMTEDGEMTTEQASCLIDSVSVDMLSALATDVDSLDSAGAVALLDVFADCGIDPSALG